MDEPVEKEKDINQEEKQEEASSNNNIEEPLSVADKVPKDPKKTKNQRKKMQKHRKKQREIENKLLAEGKEVPTAILQNSQRDSLFPDQANPIINNLSELVGKSLKENTANKELQKTPSNTPSNVNQEQPIVLDKLV